MLRPRPAREDSRIMGTQGWPATGLQEEPQTIGGGRKGQRDQERGKEQRASPSVVPYGSP